MPQEKQKAAPLYGCLIIYFPYCGLIVPNYGNLQLVDVMNGFYPELLGKEIPDKKLLQARINSLLQKWENKMLMEKSEEAEFTEIE